MTAQSYVGTAERTFKAAVVHLLETDYGVLGSQRVLDLLARDLQTLVDQFYPTPDHVSSGWMVFTGTKATGNKAYPGKSAADYELVTLAWPVLLPEDTQRLASLPIGRPGSQTRATLLQDRLARIIEHGRLHPQGPVLLTVADLAAMFSLSISQIGRLLAKARLSSGKPLLTKGYYFDQGMRPSHKDQIIALYEAGLDETVIALQTNHAQTSVGQYIRDYERVKLLLVHHTSLERIPVLIDMRPSVARAYVDLIRQYHPDLIPEAPQSPT